MVLLTEYHFDEELPCADLGVRNQHIVQRDRRWNEIYMPAFRDYYEKETHINARRDHPILGKLLHSIRCGRSQVPPQFEDELRSMGLDTRNQMIVRRDKLWGENYMPALREYYEKEGHVNVPYSHPIIGMLLCNIRRGNTQVPPQYDEELCSMGFFYCVANLAKHVTRVLNRAVQSLDDPEARQAVNDTATAHSRLLTRRQDIKGKKALLNAGLLQVPFGSKSLGDGMARFVADMKLLQQGGFGTKKRKRESLSAARMAFLCHGVTPLCLLSSDGL